MKGIIVIILGILLIALCGLGYRYLNLDGPVCGLIAVFVGGQVVCSGLEMVVTEDKDEEKGED